MMETVLTEEKTGILTEKQRCQWKKDGYPVLNSILPSEEVRDLTVVVD